MQNSSCIKQVILADGSNTHVQHTEEQAVSLYPTLFNAQVQSSGRNTGRKHAKTVGSMAVGGYFL